MPSSFPRDEMARAFRVLIYRTANQPPLPAVFPVRANRPHQQSERLIGIYALGLPPPPNVTGRAVTNVRNSSSANWRSCLQPRFRCLVHATSYCEFQDGSNVPAWFALGPKRPVFALARIWRSWREMRAM
jgi:putative SOS response-associated peptidase YedK